MVRKERYKTLRTKVEYGEQNVVGEFGVDETFVPNKIIEILNKGILEDIETFEEFVGKYSEKYFKWDKFNYGKDVKDALFARFLVNTERFFTKKGNEYILDGKIFNGTLYIPKGVQGEGIRVLKSNFFSRMSLMDVVKGLVATDEFIMESYRDILQNFDNENYKNLDKFMEGQGSVDELDNILSRTWTVMSGTVNVMLKTKDGYMYVLRGKRAVGAGKVSFITGILDRLNVEELILAELVEELGITDSIGKVENEVNSLVEQVMPERRVVTLCSNFIVDVDKEKDEIERLHKGAKDNYESEGLYFNRDVKDIRRDAETKGKMSVTMDLFLDYLT